MAISWQYMNWQWVGSAHWHLIWLKWQLTDSVWTGCEIGSTIWLTEYNRFHCQGAGSKTTKTLWRWDWQSVMYCGVYSETSGSSVTTFFMPGERERKGRNPPDPDFFGGLYFSSSDLFLLQCWIFLGVPAQHHDFLEERKEKSQNHFGFRCCFFLFPSDQIFNRRSYMGYL